MEVSRYQNLKETVIGNDGGSSLSDYYFALVHQTESLSSIQIQVFAFEFF